MYLKKSKTIVIKIGSSIIIDKNNKMIKKMDKKIIIDSRRILTDKDINADYNAIGIGDNV